MNFEPNYMGYDGFVWWMGVVEDRLDPLKLGRCRIRIAGAHTNNKAIIPTADLPWAHPMLPITDSSMLMAKEGDYVIGFYLDGANAQHPVMMGILPGIPDQLLTKTSGFADPRSDQELATAPRPPKSLTFTPGSAVKIAETDGSQRYPNPDKLNEPTISRLTRNQKTDETIVQYKKSTLLSNMSSTGGKSFNEPASEYAAAYPYNRVIESESGHVFELDDTPGAERVHIYHRSGTFIELHSDGTMVTKVGTDQYEFVLSDKYVYIGGDCTISSGGNINLKSAKDIVMEASNIRMKADGEIKIQSAQTLTVQSDEANMKLWAAGEVLIQGSTLNMNPGAAAPLEIAELAITTVEGSEGLRKLIELEGIEAPYDGGDAIPNADGTSNAVQDAKNAVSFSSPAAGPSVADLPVGAVASQASEVDTKDAPLKTADADDCDDTKVYAQIPYDLQLSPHFRLKDLTKNMIYPHDIPVSGNMGKTAAEIICNLKAVAVNILEPLVQQYPGFRVNSAFRAASGPSQHNIGEGCDLQWPGRTIADMFKIAQWIRDNLPFDQVIFEYGNSVWIHVSYRRPKYGGLRAPAASNKVISMNPGGWPKLSGLYTQGLVLLADKAKIKCGGGGKTYS